MKKRSTKLNLILMVSLLLLPIAVTATMAMLKYTTNMKSNGFQFVKPDNILAYYEIYEDDGYGFYYYDKDGTLNTKNKLNSGKEIKEAGYSVLSNYPAKSDGKRELTWQTQKDLAITPKAKNGTDITFAGTDLNLVDETNPYYLYAVSQTEIGSGDPKPLELLDNFIPQAVVFDKASMDGVAKHCISNFAKGVYKDTSLIAQNYIRTPQQMKNMTSTLTNWNTVGKTFDQEMGLDFSKTAIGGNVKTSPLTTSVVNGKFWGTYIGNDYTIKNVTIDAPTNAIGLFSENSGTITTVQLADSSIKGMDYVGGIVGINISGATITGSDAISDGTKMNIPQVMGDVTISGNNHVGGIVGYNNGTLIGTMVQGMKDEMGRVTEGSVIITGTGSIGGITGSNGDAIIGNSVSGVNFPDVTGNVSITGTGDSIGGIVGVNTGSLDDVDVYGGRPTPVTIQGNNDVGGIVGTNGKDLGVGGVSVVSTRGNVKISGNNQIGGIVGNHYNTGSLNNCFVYDALSYGPQIIATGNYAGGIAGKSAGKMNHSATLSTKQAALVKIQAGSYVGGVVGYNQYGSDLVDCSVLGNVQVKTETNFAGGIVGGHEGGASITTCWIGNSDGIGTIAKGISKGLKLDNPMTTGCGTPNVLGAGNIGGIVGFNGGTVQNIKISDNVIIGIKSTTVTSGNIDGSNFAGGIVGGNASGALIQGCSIKNDINKTVNIQGAESIGGIVGLNNGVVLDCHISDIPANQLTIQGNGRVGGIAGQNGGNMIYAGNANTKIENCTVTGSVAIQSPNNSPGYLSFFGIGGIVGQNGSTNHVINCTVKGNAGAPITISGSMSVGGIVGVNEANITGCKVDGNVHITATTGYLVGKKAGGIAGIALYNGLQYPDGYNPNDPQYKEAQGNTIINDCIVTGPVIIKAEAAIAGGLIGDLDNTVTNQVVGSGNRIDNVSNNVKVISPSSPGGVWGETTMNGTIGCAGAGTTGANMFAADTLELVWDDLLFMKSATVEEEMLKIALTSTCEIEPLWLEVRLQKQNGEYLEIYNQELEEDHGFALKDLETGLVMTYPMEGLEEEEITVVFELYNVMEGEKDGLLAGYQKVIPLKEPEDALPEEETGSGTEEDGKEEEITTETPVILPETPEIPELPVISDKEDGE